MSIRPRGHTLIEGYPVSGLPLTSSAPTLGRALAKGAKAAGPGTPNNERCAVTGLKLINGGGRAEVEAAHIRPVEANGPDIVSNGLALSGTAHWMFDRGLIGLDDDLRIVVSRQANDPDSIRAIINASGQALLPQREAERPHPQFIRWHREHCFKP